jgi:hypothetical protein
LSAQSVIFVWQETEQMPRYDIIYSVDPASKAVFSESVVARDRIEAGSRALTGFESAQQKFGARCYRVIDGLGMVVTRGPKAVITRSTE